MISAKPTDELEGMRKLSKAALSGLTFLVAAYKNLTCKQPCDSSYEHLSFFVYWGRPLTEP